MHKKTKFTVSYGLKLIFINKYNILYLLYAKFYTQK